MQTLHKALLILAGSLLAVQANSAKAGSNLIVNGDFGAGNTGFTSQYAYSPGDLYPANTYDVASDPNADNGNWPNPGGRPWQWFAEYVDRQRGPRWEQHCLERDHFRYAKYELRFLDLPEQSLRDFASNS